MRTTVKIFLVISIICLLLAGYAFINTQISLKYEVLEPNINSNVNLNEIELKGNYIREIIFFLKVFLGYVLSNIVLLITILIKTKKDKRPETND